MCIKGFLVLTVLVSTAESIDDTLYFDKSKPSLEIPLTTRDFERARYSHVHIRQHSNTWSRSDDHSDRVLYRRDRFEGDIVGVDARTLQSSGHQRTGVFRSAVRNRFQTWPTRRIPYAISSQYSSFSRSRIASALDEYSKKTCVRFVPRTNERDYVFIAPDDGCYSTIGRAGGKQVVSIGSGCVNFGIIIHELMHSVGFFHEQSRPDRDEYVTVNWTNVADDMKDQFIKYNHGMINTMGFVYDYGSVMHYSNRAFTKNGEPTLLPRADGVKIGQREGFSQLDANKINALYSCDEFTSPKSAATSDQSAMFEQTSSTSATFLPDPSPLPAPSPPTTNGKCADEMDDCAYRKGLGYCDTIPHWMARFCKKTCGACFDDGDGSSIDSRSTDSNPDSCSDAMTPHCNAWAKSGFCNGYPRFVEQMRKNCKKTCGFC